MNHLFATADAIHLPLLDKSIDLVIGSPPYMDARTYGIGAQRNCRDWVDWMLRVTEESVRVSRGLVLWVVAGVTRKHCYWPGPEGLLWEWWKRGGEHHCWRPCFWHRVGIPGSGGKQWFRADVEYILAFKRPGPLPYADNTACGHPPKWEPGGQMTNRLKDGRRCHAINERKADGTMGRQHYTVPDLVNPGNLLRVVTGGGHLGWEGGHLNEAPFPLDIPDFFIKSLTKPGDLVLDPFSGSGTTVNAAVALGRRGIGFDLRMSQCKLGRMRLEDPHHPSVRRKQRREEPKTPSLFDLLLIGEDA